MAGNDEFSGAVRTDVTVLLEGRAPVLFILCCQVMTGRGYPYEVQLKRRVCVSFSVFDVLGGPVIRGETAKEHTDTQTQTHFSIMMTTCPNGTINRSSVGIHHNYMSKRLEVVLYHAIKAGCFSNSNLASARSF